VLAGLSDAAGLFFSYAFWVLIFPIPAILTTWAMIAYPREGKVALRRAALTAAAAALSAATTWLGLWLLARFDLPSSLHTAAETLAIFNHKRPYRVWVLLNMVDFIQHLGLPLACVTVLGLAGPAVGGERGARGYAWLFWTFIVALDLTGWNRGEVARLWIFLMPLCLVALYQLVGTLRLRGPQLAGLAGAQFVICGTMAGFWRNFSP